MPCLQFCLLPTPAYLTSDPAFPCVPSEEQYEERFLQEETVSQHINSVELLQTRPLAPPQVARPQRPLQRQVHLRGRPASKPTVIRGITYYKAKVPEEENDIEEQRELGSAGRCGGRAEGRESPFGPSRSLMTAVASKSQQGHGGIACGDKRPEFLLCFLTICCAASGGSLEVSGLSKIT